MKRPPTEAASKKFNGRRCFLQEAHWAARDEGLEVAANG
jgi:hypothetical protein